MRTPTDILANLYDAEAHYNHNGYQVMDVPWIVSNEVTRVTLPTDRQAISTKLGDLVGSGEQGFIDLMMKNMLPLGAYQTITPCFRDEPKLSTLTRNYFWKLELIIHYIDQCSVWPMIDLAYEYFSKWIKCEVIETHEGFDIVTIDGNVELGSYGRRTWQQHKWVFGTGLAEPRFSLVRSGKYNELPENMPVL